MKRMCAYLVLACLLLGGARAQQGTLLLSEILYQPLSGEAEYVELHNPTGTPQQLSDYHIVRVLHDSLTKHYTLPDLTVPPNAYVVLSQNTLSVSTCYSVPNPQYLVQCALPPYPNDGGSLVLSTADSQVVERLDYSPSMHSRLLRDKEGVSLERRSFERPASSQDNWFSAASTAGYGTPTAPNSQSTELLVTESSFSFSADIVSPDGDGYQDELAIEYQLDQAGLSARADIYDSRGRLVRRLLNGDLMGTGGRILWDGRAEGGAALPSGQYILMITLYDTRGTHQTLRHTVAVIVQ